MIRFRARPVHYANSLKPDRISDAGLSTRRIVPLTTSSYPRVEGIQANSFREPF